METHLREEAENSDEPDLLAFLLTWDALLGFMSKMPADQRPKYSTALTEPLDRLMITLFAVMPERPFSRKKNDEFGELLETEKEDGETAAAAATTDADVFVKQPEFRPSSKNFRHKYCFLTFMFLI